jgi:hypothetical protein
MEHRGNDGPRQDTTVTIALVLAATAVVVVGAAVLADAVAYGHWRVLAFVVLLAAAAPLLRRVPAAAARPVARRNPNRGGVPYGLRTGNEIALVVLLGFAPFLGFGMSEGCGGCPQAIHARNGLVIGTLLVGAWYLHAQRRGSTPEAAARAAAAVGPLLLLLLFAASAYVSAAG